MQTVLKLESNKNNQGVLGTAKSIESFKGADADKGAAKVPHKTIYLSREASKRDVLR